MTRVLPIILILLLTAVGYWLVMHFRPMGPAFQLGPVTPQHPLPVTEVQLIADDGPTVNDVMARMRAAYADARTYRDTGVVELVFRRAKGAGDFADYRPFRTEFIQPEQFRFEYETVPHPSGASFGPRQRYVIWQNGAIVRSWWTIRPEVREWDSLDSALGAANGVSGGSSNTIAGLLFPGQIPYGGGIHLAEPVLAGVQEVDGAMCHRIEDARPRHRERLIVWIDVERFLIRRIYEESKIEGNTTVEQMTVYDGEVNVEANPERFQFKPPM